MSRSSSSAMDWEAQYEAGVFNANTAALARRLKPSGSGRAQQKKPGGALLDSDEEDGHLDSDITMASASASASTRVAPIAPIYDEQEDNDTPLSQLTRHWMNERHAPDILPAQEELLSSLLDHIRRQVCVFLSALCYETDCRVTV